MNLKPIHVDLWVAQGDRFDALGTSVEVRHVPGHCPGNVLFYFAAQGTAFVGDALFNGSIGRTDLPGGNFEQLEHAIRQQIYTLPVDTVIYPGHGNVIDRPVDVMTQYIQHRLERERQILACLRETGPDAAAIVSRIDVGLAESLRAAARLTVEAHLETLRDEGRLEQDGTGT